MVEKCGDQDAPEDGSEGESSGQRQREELGLVAHLAAPMRPSVVRKTVMVGRRRTPEASPRRVCSGVHPDRVDRDRDLLTHREPGVRHSEQRSGGAHGSQLNWEHLLSAGSNGGAVVRATSPGALMTAWDRVTQPIAPRNAHSAAAIATRVAALGNSAPWFMSDLPSSAG